ncbi:hypothetical protein ACFLW3_00360 [Chloroflexota bacterium]
MTNNRDPLHIEIEPELSACVETKSKRLYEQTLKELLNNDDETLAEKLQILKLFLESADFSQLRRQSEKPLVAGKKVRFILPLAGGKPEYEMKVT